MSGTHTKYNVNTIGFDNFSLTLVNASFCHTREYIKMIRIEEEENKLQERIRIEYTRE